MGIKSVRFKLVTVAAMGLMVLGACGSNGSSGDQGAADPGQSSASDPTAADTAGGSTSSAEAPATSATSDKVPYIAIVAKGFTQTYWQAVKKGAEAEAAKEGVRMTFEGPAGDTNIEGQLDIVSDVISRHPDVIGFTALDSKASVALLDRAQKEGIIVVAFDSGVDSDIPVTTAATDNAAAAEEAAKHLSELIGGTGLVAMNLFDETSIAGVQRRDGFVNWIKANAPGIKLLDPQYNHNDLSQSTEISKAYITANPDLKAIYANNEMAAMGTIQAIKETGVKGLTVVGFDSGSAQVQAIKDGVIAGSITQHPDVMGRDVIINGIKALRGEAVPKTIDTGFAWYDKTNMDDPSIAPSLYE